MHESRQHHQLVIKGASYIQSQHPGALDVQIDDYGDLGASKVLYYLQYEPDIIGQSNDYLIIGEAKTEKDILTSHSKKQYKSYLQYKDKSERDVYFYLFVPWQVKATAHNFLKNFCKKECLSETQWLVVSEVELLDY